jgi:hypothetical protein
MSFSNVNGVSFATAAGSAIQASVNTSYRASNDAVGLNTAQTNVTWTVNSSGISLNAAGYAGTGFSGTNATATLNSNGLQLSVAAPGAGGGIGGISNSQTMYTSGTVILSEGGGAITIASGANQSFKFSVPQTSSIVGTSGISISTAGSTISVYPNPLSVWEPFPVVTGSGVSSHAPASIWFTKFNVSWPVAVSNVQVMKSLNASVAGGTSAASSGSVKISYSNGFTLFTRQDFGANSTNISQWTTASFGATGTYSFTSTAQSVALSWVTNSTGGTTSFSTTSNAGNWSRFFTGLQLFQIPLVTTLTPGEYFVGQQHSTTTATGGNSNFTLLSFSNFHIVPQTLTIATITSSGSLVSSVEEGIGVGVASAVTTNNTMGANAISAGTQNGWYMHFQNM